MEVDTSHLAGAGSAALGGNQSGDKKLEPQRKSFSYFPRHVLHMYPRQAANKFPPCIPPEHRNKVSEMRKALTKAGLKADHFQNCTLYRFLKARDHNVPKATAMFSEMVRWRKEFGADTISEADFEPMELHRVRELYRCNYHKTDRVGRPVFVLAVRDMDMDALLRVTTLERLIRIHVCDIEDLMRQKLPMCSIKSGRHIDRSVNIVDVKGLGLRNFDYRAKEMIQKVSKLDSDYYPELLHRMFIINVPMAFKTMWLAIKPLLEKETRSKIEVLGTDYKARLLEVIDEENLPSFFGGKCTCNGRGGCWESGAGPWEERLGEETFFGALKRQMSRKRPARQESSPSFLEAAARSAELLPMEEDAPAVPLHLIETSTEAVPAAEGKVADPFSSLDADGAGADGGRGLQGSSAGETAGALAACGRADIAQAGAAAAASSATAGAAAVAAAAAAAGDGVPESAGQQQHQHHQEQPQHQQERQEKGKGGEEEEEDEVFFDARGLSLPLERADSVSSEASALPGGSSKGHLQLPHPQRVVPAEKKVMDETVAAKRANQARGRGVATPGGQLGQVSEAGPHEPWLQAEEFEKPEFDGADFLDKDFDASVQKEVDEKAHPQGHSQGGMAGHSKRKNAHMEGGDHGAKGRRSMCGISWGKMRSTFCMCAAAAPPPSSETRAERLPESQTVEEGFVGDPTEQPGGRGTSDDAHTKVYGDAVKPVVGPRGEPVTLGQVASRRAAGAIGGGVGGEGPSASEALAAGESGGQEGGAGAAGAGEAGPGAGAFVGAGAGMGVAGGATVGAGGGTAGGGGGGGGGGGVGGTRAEAVRPGGVGGGDGASAAQALSGGMGEQVGPTSVGQAELAGRSQPQAQGAGAEGGHASSAAGAEKGKGPEEAPKGEGDMKAVAKRAKTGLEKFKQAFGLGYRKKGAEEGPKPSLAERLFGRSKRGYRPVRRAISAKEPEGKVSGLWGPPQPPRYMSGPVTMQPMIPGVVPRARQRQQPPSEPQAQPQAPLTGVGPPSATVEELVQTGLAPPAIPLAPPAQQQPPEEEEIRVARQILAEESKYIEELAPAEGEGEGEGMGVIEVLEVDIQVQSFPEVIEEKEEEEEVEGEEEKLSRPAPGKAMERRGVVPVAGAVEEVEVPERVIEEVPAAAAPVSAKLATPVAPVLVRLEALEEQVHALQKLGVVSPKSVFEKQPSGPPTPASGEHALRGDEKSAASAKGSLLERLEALESAVLSIKQTRSP